MKMPQGTQLKVAESEFKLIHDTSVTLSCHQGQSFQVRKCTLFLLSFRFLEQGKKLTQWFLNGRKAEWKEENEERKNEKAGKRL